MFVVCRRCQRARAEPRETGAPDAEAWPSSLGSIAEKLGRQFPAVEHMLLAAAPDITAFSAFPVSHWRPVWSTNPLERVNGEIERRADVAGIFPNEAAILRLVGAVLLETHDESQIAERRYLSEGSMAAIFSSREPHGSRRTSRPCSPRSRRS